MPAISLKRVYIRYDNDIALEDINLEIEPNDFLGIIGPNGGGKTTLLKTFLGLIKPDKGEIRVYGKPPSKTRSLIGYVPQISTFDYQYPINVWDVVLMGRLNKTRLLMGYTKRDKEMTAIAIRQAGMDKYTHRQIGRLSGGQIQRVLIARALTSQPKILLLDEPTASIDPEFETGLYELLHELNNELTIILVSHDIGAISQHVTSVACLNRKLFHHGGKDLTTEIMESTYGCPIDLIAHGTPHRVLKKHDERGDWHA
ncbi:MAG: ABC transporter ATP-binding protein [candidate division Zixibacteria bacterium]|nr:ABC transporter ATP-binding protein [candidate division Zixibacteria bacterium]